MLSQLTSASLVPPVPHPAFSSPCCWTFLRLLCYQGRSSPTGSYWQFSPLKISAWVGGSFASWERP